MAIFDEEESEEAESWGLEKEEGSEEKGEEKGEEKD